ncbi:cytochrome c oxidase subunit 3 [Zhongshania sp.]|uniref:cytochrome c oxidase subunit 3 n=1 Tax=Zhongshania sp. TaxID=1971902 RepID=UPI003565837D
MSLSAASESHVEEFWADKEDVPGEKAMWLFVLGDFLIFSAYFVIYLVQRAWDKQGFLDAQQHLDINLGIINTIVLITGSWFVAWAALAAREGNAAKALSLVRLTMLSGFIFAALKVFEWSKEIKAGYTFTSNDFFGFYYVLTGIHLIHLVFGLAVLQIVVARLKKGVADHRLVETGATYWHMVDLLWVLILAFLYMLR